MSALDDQVFSKAYNFTDCLALEIAVSLYHTLVTMTEGHARAAGVEGALWAIITPIPDLGYRVDLFKEKDE